MLLAASVLLATISNHPPLMAAEAQVESAITVQSVAPVHRVLGADGRSHLVYELMVVNPGRYLVTIETINAIDGESGAVLGELTGEGVARATQGGRGEVTLAPSQSVIVFMDVTVGPNIPVVSLRHQLVIGQSQAAVTAAVASPFPVPTFDIPPQISFTTGVVPVEAATITELAAPVRGAGWLIFAGCCDYFGSHRGSVGAFNGRLFIAERFAIDFVRFTDGNMLLRGGGDQLASYPQYGVPVYAAAAGIVVSGRDGEPDAAPGALPVGKTGEAAAGNSVVIDIGGGRYLFYAHLQPGTVAVRAGDRVESGAPIGMIGNSGNSFGPHLHFHLMDGPSPLAADGLPYVFASFTGEGVMGPEGLGMALSGRPAPIDRAALAGAHLGQLPLNNQVVDFGE